ncbi:MAG: hypothetical protein KAF42_16690 [Sphingopyxis terrae]|nr:hypothetical protein [Sphingopyxis terrae]
MTAPLLPPVAGHRPVDLGGEGVVGLAALRAAPGSARAAGAPRQYRVN